MGATNAARGGLAGRLSMLRALVRLAIGPGGLATSATVLAALLVRRLLTPLTPQVNAVGFP